MAKKQKSNNLEFIITKLKNSVGEIKVIEHVKGIYFGGIYEVNVDKKTLTIINETGLEKIKASEKDNLSTESIYSDSNCMEIIALSDIKSVK
jgi:hypothetical protein